ncbi:MAG TPA: hypothetical protein VGW96_07575 [Candidatus Eremiobacteraceae bacterium]|jgi:hypothetical protein|nr:hypothetical protein [Candidatus Eremiobacteraceae bacterium]
MTLEELTNYLQARGKASEVNEVLSKLGFSPDFVVTNVISAPGSVTVSHIAMLWQGMPNKHDRKRTRQLFDALTEVGLLEPKGDEETWILTTPTPS